MVDGEDPYMKDPRAKTFEGLIASFEILSKYAKDGAQTKWALHGEHDIIYSCVDTEILPVESDDGQSLRRLGWHEEEDCWAYFT